MDWQQKCEDYRRIEQAIQYLEAHYQEQPGLKQVADSLGLSEYHFQRLFARWVGISPKRFLQFITKEHAKAMLESSGNLLEVAYASGLSGPGRLHDLFVNTQAVTPGEYKQRGEGLDIAYGFHPSPFGECLLAVTGRGVCGLSFVQHGDRSAALADLRRRWPKANFHEDSARTGPAMQQVIAFFEHAPEAPLHLFLNGTNFQIQVWEALLRIPPGSVVSYGAIAAHLGRPKAARAVGSAIGQNPIPLIIPCHRVIRSLGEFGEYHWGAARKKAILTWEMARSGAGEA
jgi:AraC family transcriptional regulator of adaptative response/methylated-DNA-[protein]-cysteine methyltransferase